MSLEATKCKGSRLFKSLCAVFKHLSKERLIGITGTTKTHFDQVPVNDYTDWSYSNGEIILFLYTCLEPNEWGPHKIVLNFV